MYEKPYIGGDGISSQIILDTKWHKRLETLRNVEHEINSNINDFNELSTSTNSNLEILSYTVPRIIVIGEESSGKSSTLERIAMMQFFPADRKLCTRMPIELRLRYRTELEIKAVYDKLNLPCEDSYVHMTLKLSKDSTIPSCSEYFPTTKASENIKKWMDDIVEASYGKLTGIISDILIIEMFSTRKLNIDLIDLPGIVGGSLDGEPDDMMDQTRKLAESFVNDPLNPHCLIVAVVSNRTERVRNSQAMEIVQRYHKENYTIGVLTMIDLCKDTIRKPEDPYWELKERLDGVAQDLPRLKHGFVALKNRDTIQQHKFSTVNQAEEEWFLANLVSNCHIDNTNTTETVQIKDRSENFGISSLIKKLVHLLDDYSENIWPIEEHQRIQKELHVVDSELVTLGIVPLTSLPFLLNHIIAIMNSKLSSLTSCKVIEDECVLELSKELFTFTWGTKSNSLFKNCTASSPITLGAFGHNPTVVPTVTAAKFTQEHYSQKLQLNIALKELTRSIITKHITKNVIEVLDKVMLNKELPLCLVRYNNLYRAFYVLLSEWCATQEQEILSKVTIWLDFILRDYVYNNRTEANESKLFGSLRRSSIDSNILEFASHGLVVTYLVDTICMHLLMNPLTEYITADNLITKFTQVNDYEEEYLLQESPDYALKRLTCNYYQAGYKTMLETIHEEFPNISFTAIPQVKTSTNNIFVFPTTNTLFGSVPTTNFPLTTTGFGCTTNPFGTQKAVIPNTFNVASTSATSFGAQPQTTAGFVLGASDPFIFTGRKI